MLILHQHSKTSVKNWRTASSVCGARGWRGMELEGAVAAARDAADEDEAGEVGWWSRMKRMPVPVSQAEMVVLAGGCESTALRYLAVGVSGVMTLYHNWEIAIFAHVMIWGN